MNDKEALSNNIHWLKNKKSISGDYFKKLCTGQNPDILYIGCSDSRVPIEVIIEAKPGEVFTHRNISNIVSISDLNTLSVINYAVVHLKVKHLIVCGHRYCGGIKAAMSGGNFGLLNPWLRNIKDVYNKHSKELDSINNEDSKYDRLTELNTIEQCINALKIPEVQKAVSNNTLNVHAWLFNLEEGNLEDLKFDTMRHYNNLKSTFEIN